MAPSDESPAEGGCTCLQPPFIHTQFHRTFLGVDPQQGRYAEVNLDRCRACVRLWLHYHIEFEAESGSGRWYRGLLPWDLAMSITALTAASVLEGLPWYFAGGSYFDGNVRRTAGRLR
jgi:hypothetical protein